jgi:putative ABC transport system permease protein
VAVAGLALGINASTALFSVVNAVLLRPLPYRDPERLVMVWDSVPRQRLHHNLVSPPNFVDWRRQGPAFESMEAYTEEFLNLVVDDGQAPERVYGLAVTPLLRHAGTSASPALRAEDGSPTCAATGGLSNVFWQRRFAATRHRRRSVGPGRVVGILPPLLLPEPPIRGVRAPGPFTEDQPGLAAPAVADGRGPLESGRRYRGAQGAMIW